MYVRVSASVSVYLRYTMGPKTSSTHALPFRMDSLAAPPRLGEGPTPPNLHLSDFSRPPSWLSDNSHQSGLLRRCADVLEGAMCPSSGPNDIAARRPFAEGDATIALGPIPFRGPPNPNSCAGFPSFGRGRFPHVALCDVDIACVFASRSVDRGAGVRLRNLSFGRVSVC